MSVDEVFRPVLPEPTRVSEPPRGYSPHLKRVWQRKLVFLSKSSRCGHVEIFRWKMRKICFVAFADVNRQASSFVILSFGQSATLSCQFPLYHRGHGWKCAFGLASLFSWEEKSKRVLAVQVVLSGCGGLQCATMASKGKRRPWWRPGWRSKSGLGRHDDAVRFNRGCKCTRARKKRPLRAADCNSKWFVFLKSVIDIFYLIRLRWERDVELFFLGGGRFSAVLDSSFLCLKRMMGPI